MNEYPTADQGPRGTERSSRGAEPSFAAERDLAAEPSPRAALKAYGAETYELARFSVLEVARHLKEYGGERGVPNLIAKKIRDLIREEPGTRAPDTDDE